MVRPSSRSERPPSLGSAHRPRALDARVDALERRPGKGPRRMKVRSLIHSPTLPLDADAAVSSVRTRPRIRRALTPESEAPGAPGIPPTWTSSAKDAVGCSLGTARLWFTLGYGIVNEVYWPRVDLPQIRDLGFIVADGQGFWSEVKRGADYVFSTPVPGVPAYEHRSETGHRMEPPAPACLQE